MKQRISMWLVVACVTLLAACDAATNTAGPDMSQRAPQRSDVAVSVQNADEGAATTDTPNDNGVIPPGAAHGHSRYAMAAN